MFTEEQMTGIVAAITRDYDEDGHALDHCDEMEGVFNCHHDIVHELSRAALVSAIVKIVNVDIESARRSVDNTAPQMQFIIETVFAIGCRYGKKIGREI